MTTPSSAFFFIKPPGKWLQAFNLRETFSLKGWSKQRFGKCPALCPTQMRYLAGPTLLLGPETLGFVHLHGFLCLHLFLGFFFRNTVPLLYFADQLIPLAVDNG